MPGFVLKGLAPQWGKYNKKNLVVTMKPLCDRSSRGFYCLKLGHHFVKPFKGKGFRENKEY